MKTNNVEELPLRPIISNVGTASYKLGKYLAKILSPLARSEYTVSSTKQFIDQFTTTNVPENYKLISFDVTSLFTNVPLDFTIEIILKRIYNRSEIQTNISRAEMKELLLLCTKSVHFSYNDSIYVQSDGVAMGSPLGPVLANIFMVELEREVLPTLAEHMLPWKRYVDDTVSWIKETSVELVTEKLHSFHQNIKFTHEMENKGTISFLDVLLTRTGNSGELETKVYRKKTDSDIYLHWNAFAPIKWKRGTLRTLLIRAFNNCSSIDLLEKEIEHLHHVFNKINGYPWWIINQETNKIRNEMAQSNNTSNNEEETPTEVENIESTIMLPYQGDKGDKLLNSLFKTITKVETKHKTKLIYTGTKMSTCFNIKDKTKTEHENGLVYKYKCQQTDCEATYIGETARRFSERIKDHCGRDHKSHVFLHTLETGHQEPTKEAFSIISKNNKLNNYFVRSVVESLLIKRNRPKLNYQEKSFPLKLFN